MADVRWDPLDEVVVPVGAQCTVAATATDVDLTLALEFAHVIGAHSYTPGSDRRHRVRLDVERGDGRRLPVALETRIGAAHHGVGATLWPLWWTAVDDPATSTPSKGSAPTCLPHHTFDGELSVEFDGETTRLHLTGTARVIGSSDPDDTTATAAALLEQLSRNIEARTGERSHRLRHPSTIDLRSRRT